MFTDYPKAATNNAKRAIRIKEENDRGCGTKVGWTRARQLADRKPISLDTVRRMASFNRHRQHSGGDPKESCGPLMWLAWGGDEGISWAIKKSDQNKMIQFKNVAQKVQDLDKKKGVVSAYANVYEVEDKHNDISAIGSFKRTVNNNKKRIRVLKDHNSTISLGVPLEIDAEDPYGLKTLTKFNMNKEVARDMFTDLELMMENDIAPELSIGYDVVKRDEQNTKRITEYKLYEYSFLTGWGANMLSVVDGIKSLRQTQGVVELIMKSYDLDYSDSRLVQIEQLLKDIDEGKDLLLDVVSPEEGTQHNPTKVKEVFETFNIKWKEDVWTLKK